MSLASEAAPVKWSIQKLATTRYFQRFFLSSAWKWKSFAVRSQRVLYPVSFSRKICKSATEWWGTNGWSSHSATSTTIATWSKLGPEIPTSSSKRCSEFSNATLTHFYSRRVDGRRQFFTGQRCRTAGSPWSSFSHKEASLPNWPMATATPPCTALPLVDMLRWLGFWSTLGLTWRRPTIMGTDLYTLQLVLETLKYSNFCYRWAFLSDQRLKPYCSQEPLWTALDVKGTQLFTSLQRMLRQMWWRNWLAKVCQSDWKMPGGRKVFQSPDWFSSLVGKLPSTLLLGREATTATSVMWSSC